MNRAAIFKNAHRTKVSDHTFGILKQELIDSMKEFHKSIEYIDPDIPGDDLLKLLDRWNKRKNKSKKTTI